jgi:hypothetical protein
MKKIALQYGLIITAGVAAWVIIAHLLVPDPRSPVHSIGAMSFFNILHFVVIYLGISALGRLHGERASFKQSVKMGVWISFVYGITAALFFVVVLMVVGTKWMAGEPGAQQLPMTAVALQAFAGLLIGAILFGLIYSTVIAFALAKRLPKST